MSGSIYSGPVTPGARSGIASVTIGGEAVDIAGDPKWQSNEILRTTLKGNSGIQDFSVEYEEPFISFNARYARQMTKANIMALDNVNVTMIMVDGTTISGSGMWCVECGEMNATDGTFPVKFGGRKVTES